MNRRTLLTAALLAPATVGLAACSSKGDTIADQARSGDQKGYNSGDGTIEVIPADKRGAPLALTGPTIDGKTYAIAEHAGAIVVVNVWGSWCPPCISETPALLAAYKSLTAAHGSKVAFLGVDIKENPESALAFHEANKIPYPSLAYENGAVLMALRGLAPATPTTLVLDTQHRPAARVLGVVTAPTIEALVSDLISGKS